MKGRKTMNLLIVLAFPNIVALVTMVCIYTEQIYCGTEEWS
jgi:hypothetical protein